jgi:hypothetical protein
MRAIVLAVLALSLAACSGDRGLRDMRTSGGGPDEFAVTPNAPLELPQDLALPTPTPGAGNLTDINPNANAIAALGGRPSSASAGGVPTSDSALVSFASRNGVQSDVRAFLAQEDEAFRKRAGNLSFFNFLGRDRYFSAYRRHALDAYTELERFRAAGIATPTAPPQ